MRQICQQYNIEEIVKEPKLCSVFYRWMASELVYTSNAIELNKLTRKENEEVLSPNGKKPANKYKDSIEAINLAATLDRSLFDTKNGKKIDEEFIMSMHSGIMRNIDNSDAGFYRNCNVRALGCCFGYTNCLKIPQKMSELIDFINDPKMPVFNMAIEAHYRLVKVHPFSDGNGRTARLLMNIILMNNGIIPIFVTPENRTKYIDSLGIYRVNKDGAPYQKFMQESFYNSALTICNFWADNKIR